MDFQIQFILQLAFATFLGALIGIEREFKGKEAGIQTYSLVCMGSCFFTVMFYILCDSFSLMPGISFDPARIIHAIAVGVGFIGAGVIMREQSGIKGITTAAALWVVAAIGVAVGLNYYILALGGSLLTFLILFGFGEIEKRSLKNWEKKE